jgi:hypothetical protein
MAAGVEADSTVGVKESCFCPVMPPPEPVAMKEIFEVPAGALTVNTLVPEPGTEGGKKEYV